MYSQLILVRLPEYIRVPAFTRADVIVQTGKNSVQGTPYNVQFNGHIYYAHIDDNGDVCIQFRQVPEDILVPVLTSAERRVDKGHV
jgi:hypothetical protein